jgi:hypothetical protein
MRFHTKEPSLAERIQFLEDKVKILEGENVETTNCLYEMENRLQTQIDVLINYTMLNKDVEYLNDKWNLNMEYPNNQYTDIEMELMTLTAERDEARYEITQLKKKLARILPEQYTDN